MVPENIRYGVTITPPDGDPVTGTAIPEFNPNESNVIAFAGYFKQNVNTSSGGVSFNSNATIQSVNGSSERRAQIKISPTIKGNYVVAIYVAVKGGGNPSSNNINVNGNAINMTSAAIATDNTTFLYGSNKVATFTQLLNVTDTITIEVSKIGSTSTITLYGFAFYTATTGLSGANVVNGVTIGNTTGTMVKKNSYLMGGIYTNSLSSSIYTNNFGLIPEPTGAAIVSGATAQGSVTTSSNFNSIVTYTYSDGAGTKSMTYQSPSGSTHNVTMVNNGYSSDTNTVTGNTITNFNPNVTAPADGGWFGIIMQAKYPEPVPGYENLKPENIRAGVTITPPGGSPVTGTAYPVGSEFNNCNYGFYMSGSTATGIGTLPTGVTVTVQFNNQFKIGGSGIVTGYISSRYGLSCSGDFTATSAKEGVVHMIYIPPTTLTNGITVANTQNLYDTVVALTTVTSTGLVAENIMNGITVNNVTGNYAGSNNLVMKIHIQATNYGAVQFFTSTGQTSSKNDSGKNVEGITTNKGRVFLLSSVPENSNFPTPASISAFANSVFLIVT